MRLQANPFLQPRFQGVDITIDRTNQVEDIVIENLVPGELELTNAFNQSERVTLLSSDPDVRNLVQGVKQNFHNTQWLQTTARGALKSLVSKALNAETLSQAEAGVINSFLSGALTTEFQKGSEQVVVTFKKSA